MTNGKGLKVVVKIGTSSLIGDSDGTTNLELSQLAETVEVLSSLRRAGHDVVLVSSGAVGAGCQKLGLDKKPKDNYFAKRALASIGQVQLMEKYNILFSTLGQNCAQVLLTYENFVDRTQFLNAKRTFLELFELGCIPIVNENDSVGIQELKTDNDKLALMVGNLVGADAVFFMTDVDGVYTANPFKDKNAKRIGRIRHDNDDDVNKLEMLCKRGKNEESRWGTGGMPAKIQAAVLAASLGMRSVIMNAKDVSKIKPYVDSQSEGGTCKYDFGTTFEKNSSPPIERKRWIRSLHRRGKIILNTEEDEFPEECKVVSASECIKVEGKFDSLEAVSIENLQGTELACGLSSFSSSDLQKVLRDAEAGDSGDESEEIFFIEQSNLDVAC
mmetsp:Transcript_464/g.633  ORF Transcript_464/g.633 Transcript_464/m.633 type:complete len:386 (-) Transcript_464:27-1184(-)